MITLFLLLGVAAFAIYNYRNYAKRFRDIDRLPGPSTFRLLKELYFSSSSRGITTYYRSLIKTYGPVVKVWLKPFRPVIITSDMEYCSRIYKDKLHHVSPVLTELSFMGDGVATNRNYDNWKRDKQVLLKAVTREYIGKKFAIYDRKYDELLEMIRRKPEAPIDVEKHLRRMLLEALIATFEHPHVDVTAGEIQRFIDDRKSFFALLMEKMNSFRCMGVFHKLTENYKLITARRDAVIKFGRDWVEKFGRVEEGLRDTTNLVYAMMDGGMPHDRIADNVNTIIEGGYDTSILPLSMTLREMGRRPELQQKLLDEIVGVMGDDITRQVTLADVDRMPYAQAMAKEAVRRFMPFPFIDRETVRDMTIGGTRIPKGTRVMFNLTEILTAEENYEEPLLFKPERFLKENVTSRAQKAFVGFGYGGKICIGKYIAYAAMKLLLVKIVREFEILHVEHDVQLVAEFFYRSVSGVPVAFRRRTAN